MGFSAGSFAEGLVSGYKAGLDMMDRRDKRNKEKEREARYKKVTQEQAAKEGTGAPATQNSLAPGESGGIPNDTKLSSPAGANPFAVGLDAVQNPTMTSIPGSTDTPINPIDTKNYGEQGYACGGAVKKKFADGGLAAQVGLDQDQYTAPTRPRDTVVSAPDSGVGDLVYRYEQSKPAPVQNQTPQRPSDYEMGARLSRILDAQRDAAMQAGDMEDVVKFQEAGFKVRDRLFNEGIANAQRAFNLSGDIGGIVKLYNDTISDGVKITDHTQDGMGNYTLKFKTTDGQEGQRTFTGKDIASMVYNFSDPKARYNAEISVQAQLMQERQKRHVLNQGDSLVTGSGEVLATNAKPTKTESNSPMGKLLDDYDAAVKAGDKERAGLIRQQIDKENYIKPEDGKEPKNPVKENLPVLNQIREIITNTQGIGSFDAASGKMLGNENSNRLGDIGERVYLGNPHLTPATVAQIAIMGQVGSATLDDGSQQAAIQYKGQTYLLGNAVVHPRSDTKTSPERPQPKPQQKTTTQAPAKQTQASVQPASKPAPVPQKPDLGHILPRESVIPPKAMTPDEARRTINSLAGLDYIPGPR